MRHWSRLIRPAVRGVLVAACLVPALQAETLYNGIHLPSDWPPRTQRVSYDPPPVPPYLKNPPEVIPIDVGRQLFVDHFLIESTTLRRSFHPSEYYAGNPVLQPDRPWERSGESARAMVFSDGVWFDPEDGLYKMWYMGPNSTLYANSLDGVHWEKPKLDVEPGTNIVHLGRRDSSTVWLDLDEQDPVKRYKLGYSTGHLQPFLVHFSPDGIHWGDPVAQTPPVADRTTFFWNPFRQVWVLSLRDHTPGSIDESRLKTPGEVLRFRSYREHSQLMAATRWEPDEVVRWVGADRLDTSRVDLNARPELYNLDVVAYESLLVGFFTIWRGQPLERGKPNEVVIGFSRDGFHWDRSYRKTFMDVSEQKEDWNWSNVQSAGGGFLVVGNRLFFYCSGRTGPRDSTVSATGLATLRRDGFVSMDAGDVAGSLTTRPVRFLGKHLFVNVDVVAGELRVEILERNGQVIEPYSIANSIPVRTNNTLERVRWEGVDDLSALSGKPVRFRFHLRHGSLYSFWVSPDSSGASHGYVAAGGPGFEGPVDTVGSEIFRVCCAKLERH